LPLDELRPYFYQFYRHVLSYQPVLSSTPFARAASWAGIVSHFPQFLHTFENPAVLLEQLLSDAELRMKFLFCSFMPERFYGRGSDRYPGQAATIEEWARHKRFRGIRLRCLDAASGDGASTYGVTRLLAKQGWEADRLEIEGWTLEPLETWAAAYNRFPHDPAHEAVFRKNNVDCFEQKLTTAIRFCYANILDVPKSEHFDLILCNGLLGGPIINDVRDVETVVRNLSGLLTPGGLLLAADHFHGGWKQKCPQQKLRALCELNGLTVIETAEGIAALMR
jgi:SAM-dependent methyltransferase